MTDATELLSEAAACLARERPGITELADRAASAATKFRDASNWLANRSIGTRVSSNKAWQGDYPYLYFKGDGVPGPESEYDVSLWEHLTENQATTLIEERAGLTYSELTNPTDELLAVAERLRREVLVCLEPVAQDDQFSFVGDDLAELRKRKLACSSLDVVESIRPETFIIEGFDPVIATPLHIAHQAEDVATFTSVKAVRELLDDLTDTVARMQKRAKLTPATATAPHQVAPEDRRPEANAPAASVQSGSISENVLLLLVWTVLVGVGFAAILKTGWLGDGKSSVWAKAAVAGFIGAALYFLARRLLNERFASFAVAFGVFVAVFGLAAVVFDSFA